MFETSQTFNLASPSEVRAGGGPLDSYGVPEAATSSPTNMGCHVTTNRASGIRQRPAMKPRKLPPAQRRHLQEAGDVGEIRASAW